MADAVWERNAITADAVVYVAFVARTVSRAPVAESQWERNRDSDAENSGHSGVGVRYHVMRDTLHHGRKQISYGRERAYSETGFVTQ